MSGSPVPLRSSNASFVALGVVMLLAIGGLLYWKTSSDEPTEVVEQAAPSRTEAQPALPDAAPPPPPPEEAAEPESSPSSPATSQSPTIDSGCSGPCEGVFGAEGESALRAKGSQARGCYNRALRQNAALSGKIGLSLRIGSSGHVCSVKVTEDTLGDPEVTSCVTRMFHAGKFPAPRGGCVEANVPLNFVSQR